VKIKSAVTIASLSALVVTGCVSAVATKTSSDGTTESISVKGFLENIANGIYTNSAGISLSVNSATPDEQSIAVLSAGVVDLGKASLLLAAQGQTNTATTSTNSTK
jgi:hypothetical protein